MSSFRSASQAVFFLIAALFIACQTPVQTPRYACYRSAHFHVYYLESDYTTAEVIPIAGRKERLLDYVNKALGLSFDGVIDAYLFLFSSSGEAWAGYNGITCESRFYAMNDDGHEIIHVVTFTELGIPLNDFMIEGVAEAFQLDFDNPIERFVSYCTERNYKPSYNSSIADQMAANTFDHTYFSYLRAGAFISHLHATYGLSNVKNYYRASVADTGKKLADDFAAIFGSTMKESENQFYVRYFPDTLLQPVDSQ